MSSSGKGQAGLELARALWGGFRVHGVTATREFDVPARTAAIANEAAGALGLDVTVRPEDVVNFDDFVGPGYGRPSPEGTEAVRLFARTEALVLDPVYTGKCAAALIAHARAGRLTGDDTVVFVHTGGAPAIFTWSHLWTDDGADAPDGRP
jgi:D-cysteine desulfhydrase/L-cysteate sulfo-lyase